MNLADQPQGERKSGAQPFETVAHCSDVVRDFLYVFDRGSGNLLIFEEKKVRERRLRAFDLRGKHGLLANIGVEQQRKIGQQRGESVQSPNRLICLL
jgi:hypothetical protein